VARVGVEKLMERLLGVSGMRVRGARFEPRGVVVEVRPPRRKSRWGVVVAPARATTPTRRVRGDTWPWGAPPSG
jgi:hypothetical protein